MNDTPAGRLYGVGVGPGALDYLTLRAARLIEQTSAVAFFAARDRPGNARTTVAPLLGEGHHEIRLEYPVTTDAPDLGPNYDSVMSDFYDRASERVAAHLELGDDVVVLCEGDPMLYGSYMYLHTRLASRFRCEVVAGVTSFSAAAATLGTPLVSRDEVFTVLSGVMDESELTDRLGVMDAGVIMKLGRNFDKVRRAVDAAGLLARAYYVERVSMEGERCDTLANVVSARAPYFSMIVVPGSRASRR